MNPAVSARSIGSCGRHHIRTRLWCCCATALLTVLGARPVHAQHPAFDLAITIDDLPWTGAASAPDRVIGAGTSRILDALASHSVVATGFIVCEAMRARPGHVESWLEAGQSLGNHTDSHPDLNSTPIAEWIDGVRRCDTAIRALPGAMPRHFRYPMLHRGNDAERRAAAAAAIRSFGYEHAPVTVDNSEWVLATGYEAAARAGDSTGMDRIGRLYTDHIRRATAHARQVSRSRFGREVSQILLLHANRLNADWLGALLDALAADGARFVTLETALTDDVFSLEDGYIGERGLSWLYRVAPAQPGLADWDSKEEQRLRIALDPAR